MISRMFGAPAIGVGGGEDVDGGDGVAAGDVDPVVAWAAGAVGEALVTACVGGEIGVDAQPDSGTSKATETDSTRNFIGPALLQFDSE
jgi:hypothetical protein